MCSAEESYLSNIILPPESSLHSGIGQQVNIKTQLSSFHLRHLRKVILASGLLTGLEDFVAVAMQFNFSFCQILLPSLMEEFFSWIIHLEANLDLPTNFPGM